MLERWLCALVIVLSLSSIYFIDASGNHDVDIAGSIAISDTNSKTANPNLPSSFLFMDQTTIIFVGVFTSMAVGAVFGLIIEGINRKRKLKITSMRSEK